MSAKKSIKARLAAALRQKFATYKPETYYMPFHTNLLGKDRMALYSFIQSLNTNFGTSIFEPVAEELAKFEFDKVQRQKVAGERVSKDAERVIQDIMNELESGAKKPDKVRESERILASAMSGEVAMRKPTKVDLFLQKGEDVYLIDIKTAKPNKGGFKEFKQTLLTWVACYAYENFCGLNDGAAGVLTAYDLTACDLTNKAAKIHTLIAIPYNHYYPKPYERWTMAGMLDLKHELKVAEEFWDFVGGEGSYELILQAFEEVGQEMRDEIDEYFRKFKT